MWLIWVSFSVFHFSHRHSKNHFHTRQNTVMPFSHHQYLAVTLLHAIQCCYSCFFRDKIWTVSLLRFFKLESPNSGQTFRLVWLGLQVLSNLLFSYENLTYKTDDQNYEKSHKLSLRGKNFCSIRHIECLSRLSLAKLNDYPRTTW